MKTMLVLLLMCTSLCARAEDGDKYIPPYERRGLWDRILPTLEDIPDRNFGVRYSLCTFEGCDFFARNSGDERLTEYWTQWIIGRDHHPKGEEGLVRFRFGINSCNPRTNRSLVRSSTGFFAGLGCTF